MAAFVSADREAEVRTRLPARLAPVLIGELVRAEDQGLLTRGRLRLLTPECEQRFSSGARLKHEGLIEAAR